ESENVLFIRFLVGALRDSGDRLLLVCAEQDDPVIPDDWIVKWRNAPETIPLPPCKTLFALVPGVIEPDVRTAIDAAERDGHRGMLSLRNGSLLVPPEHRRNPNEVSRLEYDRLAAAAGEIGWLAAYALYFGNNFHVDPWLLCSEAWRRL